MKTATAIPSVTAKVEKNTLIIWSDNPLRVLSSAVLSGGFKEANCIVNVGVSENCGNDEHDEHWNAETFLKMHVSKLSLPEQKTVGLMTAAKMQNLAISSQTSGRIKITMFITAGTSIAVTAGEPVGLTEGSSLPTRCGTINIIAIVDGNLTQSCMVDAVKTITEAKTVALRELDVRSRFSGELASGTMTDSVAVACTGQGDLIRYAGTFTTLGELLGKSVREATKNAILKQDNLRSDRSLTERLEERGIPLEEVLNLSSGPEIEEQPHEKSPQLKMRLEELLNDPKIASLVLAGFRLDEDRNSSLIPCGQSKRSVEDAIFLRIMENVLQAYAAKNKVKADVPCMSSDVITSKKMGFLSRLILSNVLKEALSQIS